MNARRQAPTQASVVVQSEQDMQLQALIRHQALTTGRMVEAEGALRSRRALLEGTTGSARTDGEALIRDAEGDIRGIKADLEETRSRIRELRNSQDVQGSPTVIAVQEQDKIFNLKPNEFTGALIVLFVFPIVMAVSRWIWRRSPARPSRENVLDGNPQIARLEQAVESIAIEVERISEAQRFAAKLLAERAVEPVIERVADPSRIKRRVVTPLP
jgi:hypothetical protein